MDNARLAFLFKRYTEQKSTDEERLELMELIRKPAYDHNLKALMDEIWHNLQEEKNLSSNQAEKILDEILSSDRIIPIERKTVPLWRSIAAAVVIVILASGALYFYGLDREVNQTLAVSELPVREHKFIKLPDGSKVILNEGSELEYPESFDGKSSREVILTGEGYFDVKSDPSKPFIVITGKLKTTVLGTTFNIKAYPGEKNIIVTVTRGKVKVSDDNNVIGIITPNQQITYDEESSQAEQHDVNSESVIAWRERDIFFDDLTLDEAAKELEQRFDVSIIFDNDKIKNCRFTATFVRGENLEQILNVICEFNDAMFKDNGAGNIRISGPGCDEIVL
jgi:ferric-dicitrate binding protein FerR (iron transport regulator)